MFQKPEVLFFDVNETMLDLSPLKRSVTKVLGGDEGMVSLWFTTMLHYSLVTTVNEHFADFGTIGVATLQMVAGKQGQKLSEKDAQDALKSMRWLPPHADVKEALNLLKEGGYRLFALSNSAREALDDQLTHAGLKPFFEQLLSVEEVALYKPHPKVYRWAAKQAGVHPEDAMLIAAHGWDVAGAGWAGMHTAFLARPGQQLYPLADAPDLQAGSLTEIAQALLKAGKE